jgi:glucokinase
MSQPRRELDPVALTIGVDVGGTKVLGGVVDSTGQVLAQSRRATPADDTAKTLRMIAEVIIELAGTNRVQSVGIGAAGWIDVKRSTVQFAPNLAWRNEPLRDEIAAQVDLPVIVENDANAAAWAEFEFGAGSDASDSMVLFTVGTGIGGGIILGGDLVRGSHGIAGELGHTISVPDGHPCGCGRFGCLEQYASGNALIRFAKQTVTQEPGSAQVLLDLAGGDPTAITGVMVTTAAREGDHAAMSAFDQIGSWLGSAMADAVQILDPQVIVIGGGVSEAGKLLLDPVNAGYRRALKQRGRLPVAEVRPALLGNLAGVVGAADLARRA